MKNITSAVLGISLLIGSSAFAQDKMATPPAKGVAVTAPAAAPATTDTKMKAKKHTKKAVKPATAVAPATTTPPVK